MENELPKRKYPRLKDYDYSASGAYFITICTQNRKCILSRVRWEQAPTLQSTATVIQQSTENENKTSGDVKYTPYGTIAEQQLLLLEKRYPCLKIDQYVIMPNHIHMILILENETVGASPPTIMDIICAYKSLTARECKKIGFDDKLFQKSFYEHIIRDRKDYEEITRYIYENPMRWYYDELYTDTVNNKRKKQL